MTVKRLSTFTVKVGGANAAEGTHVWLSPGGGSVSFEHYQVDAQGKLVLPGTSDPVPQDAEVNALSVPWVIWDPTRELDVYSGTHPALTPGNRSRFDREDALRFGYDQWVYFPLPARIQGTDLHLPEDLTLRLRTFDLTGTAAGAAQLTQDVDLATSWYAKLRIKIEHEEGDLAAVQAAGFPAPGWNLRFEQDDKSFLKDGVPLSPQPDLSRAPWIPPSGETVLVIYVQDFAPSGRKDANAWPPLRLISQSLVDQGQAFTLPPVRCPLIVMRAVRTGSFNALAHELGHLLQFDLGLGRGHIEFQDSEKKRPRVGAKTKVRNYIAGLKIDRLPRPAGELPGQRIYDVAMFENLHAPGRRSINNVGLLPRLDNLMLKDGGFRLMDWQLATMRDSDHVS